MKMAKISKREMNYRIDFAKMTLIMTADFADKAYDPTTEEYEILTRLIDSVQSSRFITQKQKVYYKKGGKYTASPYALLWSENNYYLLAYESGKMKHFRVDKMDGIELLAQKREGKEVFKDRNSKSQVSRALKNRTASSSVRASTSLFDTLGVSTFFIGFFWMMSCLSAKPKIRFSTL